MIDEALNTKISTEPTLTAIVGSRVYRYMAPENTALPFIVWDIISTEYIEGLTGSHNAAHSQISIRAIADTAMGARNLREAIRQVLQGFSGTIGSDTIQSVGDWTEESIVEDDFKIWDGEARCSVWHDVPA